MARTPLLTWFQGLADDWRPALPEPAASLVPGPAGAAASRPRIAVVGAGIAGLTAALTLADAGHQATVYEAGDRVGGRMRCDWGGLIESSDTLALARRFQLVTADVDPGGPLDGHRFLGAFYPRGLALDDFDPVRTAVDRDVADAPFPTTFDRFTPAGFDLDQMSVRQWIDSRVPGGHRSPLGALLDVACEIELAAPTTEQSALNVVYQLGARTGPGRRRAPGAGGRRYHVMGGSEHLPRAIAAALPARSIRCGAALTAIARRRDGSYHLRFQHRDGRFEADADHVVLAVPFSVLRTLDIGDAGFDGVKLAGIRQLGYGSPSTLEPRPGWQLRERLEPAFPRITGLGSGSCALCVPPGHGACSYWRVGQCTLFGGSERRRSGRCHFAGEHCSLDFQGTVEGAVREGARAASEILADHRRGAVP